MADDELTGASCAQGVCMITGFKITPSGQPLPVILQLRGNHIRVLKPQLLRGKTFVALPSVACSKPSSCLAVGSEGPGSPGDSSADLAETWNGIRWRVARIPQPKATTELDAVACPSSTECLAVGFPVAGLGKPQTLTLLDRGGRWHRLVPTGGKPFSGAFATPAIRAISCATPASCVAVGEFGSQGAEIWNGRKLRFVTTPAQHEQLTGVSCVGPDRCVAVGGSANRAFAALWNGKNWKSLPVGG